MAAETGGRRRPEALSDTAARQPEMAGAPAEAEAPRAPWRGRKRAANPLDKVLRIRCATAELAQLDARAKAAGLSLGAYVRATVLGSAGPRAVKKPTVERELLARLLGEIGKLGGNINQIAHRVNATGDKPGAPELHEMRADIAAMRAAVMRALDRGD
jgi:hypothetical protein